MAGGPQCRHASLLTPKYPQQEEEMLLAPSEPTDAAECSIVHTEVTYVPQSVSSTQVRKQTLRKVPRAHKRPLPGEPVVV